MTELTWPWRFYQIEDSLIHLFPLSPEMLHYLAPSCRSSNVILTSSLPRSSIVMLVNLWTLAKLCSDLSKRDWGGMVTFYYDRRDSIWRLSLTPDLNFVLACHSVREPTKWVDTTANFIRCHLPVWELTGLQLDLYWTSHWTLGSYKTDNHIMGPVVSLQSRRFLMQTCRASA